MDLFFQEQVDKLKELNNMVKHMSEVIDELKKHGYWQLLIQIIRGEAITLKKEDAVCPVCGYEFEQQHIA